MTTTEARMTASGPAPLIEELFCQGHPLEHVVAVGLDVGWSRADVMAVLRDRQWDLDGSGRLPRSKRVTVPQGLRAARPLAPAAPPTQARRPRPAVVDGPSIDEWTGPDAVDVDPPADDDPPAPPARPSGAVFSAIADWADDETPTDAPPPTAEQPQQQPSSRAEPRPRRAAAILPPDADAAVARFLAERTVQAPDEQFLTSPALRDAYEAWRVWDGAPAVTPRQFGSVLTARYRKKQSPVPIEGVKPMCYFGLAWKPAAPPLLEEVLVEPAVTVDQVAAVHAELVEAAAQAETPTEAVEPATGRQPLDLLAAGLAHADRRVRSAAAAVQRAVDVLCAALSRADRRG